ncbi:MAG: phage Gp37/Gp68 family protein [Allosphingosinicella sp.]
MADASAIEWTDATWNPLRGCTRVSPGCGGPGPHGDCYAEAIAARFSDPGQAYHGLAERTARGGRWTGKVVLAEHLLDAPLRWRRPRRIFVNSMSDLFHEKVPDEWIDRIFAAMALAPRHTFQVLTKRPERMRAWFERYDAAHDHNCADMVADAAATFLGRPGARGADRYDGDGPGWPLPNVWIGVSVEDQQRADQRRADFQAVPASVKFVSYEPALGPVDWTGWEFVQQIISGGESGPRARPSHPAWHRGTRDFCEPLSIAYFFKQWGEWHSHRPRPGGDLGGDVRRGRVTVVHPTGQSEEEVFRETGGRNTIPGTCYVERVGKKAAGRRLDGRTHDAFPAPSPMETKSHG